MNISNKLLCQIESKVSKLNKLRTLINQRRANDPYYFLLMSSFLIMSK